MAPPSSARPYLDHGLADAAGDPARETLVTAGDAVSVVLVVGSSYSGSTLLGLLIGSDPSAFCAGEVNKIRRVWDPPPGDEPAYRYCTCGPPYGVCPFWSEVLARCDVRVDLNPSPGFSRRNAGLLLRGLTRRRPAPGEGIAAAYAAVARAIRDAARAHGARPSPLRIVDTSKSVRSLDALARAADVHLQVLHLVRDAGGVAASAKRRKLGPWRGMAAWSLVHASLGVHLRLHDVPVQRVDYRRLCEDPVAELRTVGSFLGLDLDPERAADRIRRGTHHLLGGSKTVRARLDGFPGIEYRDTVSELNGLQRLAARLLTRLAAPGRDARPSVPSATDEA